MGVHWTNLLFAAVLLAGCQSAPIAALRPDTATVPVRLQGADVIPASSPLQSGPEVAAPSGFLDFCRRNATKCDAGTEPDTVALDAVIWKLLFEVNQAWNTAIKPMDDAAHYGRADFWTIPKDGYGDCEDYALAKRQSLIERGISASALSIALVQTKNGTPHAVLTVSTDRGSYVLDSLNSEVLPWQATDYTWIARQSVGVAWVTVGPVGDGARLATADRLPRVLSKIP